LFQIWAYLAQHASLAVADRQLCDIRRGSRRLIRLPYSGRPRDDLIQGIRSIPVAPCVVFYRVSDIVSVLHGRRDLEVIFKH
jgi:toxin ParE1/3/4